MPELEMVELDDTKLEIVGGGKLGTASQILVEWPRS